MNRIQKAFFVMGTLCALPCASLVAQASDNAQYDYNVNVQIDSHAVNFPDAQPFVDDHNRTEVPIRFVSESLGYKVNWNMQGAEVEVSISKGDKVIVLTTGQSQAAVNGKPVQLDSNARLIEDRTYVPVRFVSEAIGYNVDWNNSDSDVIINTDGTKHAPLAFPAKVNPGRTNIVNYAKQFIGTPYSWGGTDPSGFDCSGFVNYAYAHNGITWLPRTAGDMYQQSGSFVSSLLPGDLVFFSTYDSGASHVGIYVGNNQFISATSSHGVIIDSLNSSYWGPRYLGAKRI